MRILCIADEESAAYWDYYRPEKLENIDLILSAGDLKASYLTFLVTVGRAPLLYIHGNHDERYDFDPPKGCECIDDRVVCYKGLTIAGLGGCCRYRDGHYMYTEREMRRRIRKLRRPLRGGADIILTHAPPAGYGNLEDFPHRGFECLAELIREVNPHYLLHGHIHLRYEREMPRVHRLADTQIINVGPTYILEIPDSALREQKSRRGLRKLLVRKLRLEPEQLY